MDKTIHFFRGICIFKESSLVARVGLSTNMVAVTSVANQQHSRNQICFASSLRDMLDSKIFFLRCGGKVF